MSNQEWHNISRFESYDLAKSWYQQTHQRQMNAAKTRQVNAFFIQGREYFKSASSSDLSVKPLLLYYGVLSLSRGAILLRNDSKKGESLAQSHGLKGVNWQGTLSGGIKNILDLEIQAERGTFRELVEPIPNVHQTHYFSHQSKSKAVLHHNLGEIGFCTTGELLTLGDLLSRLKQTMHAFQGVTGRVPKWFLTTVTTYAPETHFLLFTRPPDEVLRLVDNLLIAQGNFGTLMTGDEKHELASESTLDVPWVLYDRILEVDPRAPDDAERDILSSRPRVASGANRLIVERLCVCIGVDC